MHCGPLRLNNKKDVVLHILQVRQGIALPEGAPACEASKCHYRVHATALAWGTNTDTCRKLRCHKLLHFHLLLPVNKLYHTSGCSLHRREATKVPNECPTMHAFEKPALVIISLN